MATKQRGLCMSAIAIAAAAGVVAPAGASATSAGRGLVVSVSKPPSSVVEGGALSVAVKVRHRGRDVATRAVVRLYLSTNRRRDAYDLRVAGHRSVARLHGGRTAAASTFHVPAGTPAGSYYVLACVDDTRTVQGHRERSTCAASTRRTTIEAAPGRPISAFSDSTPLAYSPSTDPFLRTRQIVCPRRQAGRTPTLRGALANADRFVVQHTTAAARRAFRRSGAAKNASAAEGDAAAALGDGRPTAALAALLAAHRREPQDATHLVNAAAVLGLLGLGREALALLDAADDLDAAASSPFGLSRPAVALNNRGVALLALGRYREARAVLTRASALEPLLREARLNLAAASGCEHKDDDYARFYRLGAHRQLFDTYMTTQDGGEVPSADRIFDLGQGRETPLPQPELPATPEAGVASADRWKAFNDQEQLAHIDAANQRKVQLYSQLRQDKTLATSQRETDIVTAIAEGPRHSPLKELEERESAINRDAMNYYFSFWGNGDDPQAAEVTRMQEACAASSDSRGCMRAQCIPATRAAHVRFMDMVRQWQVAADDYVRAYSRYWTALAAHIGDPVQHELQMVELQQYVDALYYGAFGQMVAYWTTMEKLHSDVCVESSGADTDPAAGEAQAAKSDPCPPQLQAAKLKLDLGDYGHELGIPDGQVPKFEVSVNCSEIGFEAATPGWIGAFGEIGHNVGTGETSVFVGPRAGGSLGPASGSVKDGLYITFGRDGGVKDAGFRFDYSATAGTGPVELKAFGETMDFTFVGIFSG